jgi:hypothetical protein
LITYEWRGPFTSTEVSALHAAAFGQREAARNWRDQVERHSLGWVCARNGDDLAGFVNVAWDGCAWLHVDFEEHLRPFYLRGCGFTLSPAGLIAL